MKPKSIVLCVVALCMSMLLGAGCSFQESSKAPSQATQPAGAAGTHTPDTSSSLPVSQSTAPSAKPTTNPPASVKPTADVTASPKEADAAQIDHIVILVEENHSYKQIVEGSDAPYMHSLIQRGALFTNAHGITHPSQANYIALFSGSTQGVKDDSCTKPFAGANVASELLKAKLTFTGYSEDLPKVGYTGCSSKGYARKHNPWVQFSNVPEQFNRPLTDFPKDFSNLPTVSFVIPNHQNDMHDGTVKQADEWLKDHLDAYVNWAEKNKSLLIVTWDEDDFAKANHIPLIFVGPMVKPGKYEENVNHYHVLRTIEDIYHLPALGESKNVKPISTIWR
jgi:hypothetical protein